MSRRENKNKNDSGTGVESEPLKAILEVICGPEMLLNMIKFPNGIITWNNWMTAINDLMMGPTSTSQPNPFIVDVDFTRADLRGLNLEGINLQWVCLERTDFTGAILRGAQIGDCARSIFRDADLSHAVIYGEELTGTDFTGAKLGGLNLKYNCVYGRESPPIGLTPELMEKCKAGNGYFEGRIPMGHQIPVIGHVILNEEWL